MVLNTAYADAFGLPVGDPTPILSWSPVVLDVPNRPVQLEVKVTAPATGVGLPVVVFSHGHGAANFLSSLRGYGPLVDFWAAHGFVVVQPTHLDSTVLGLREQALPDAPLFWRDRALDVHVILDRLPEVLSAVPGLPERVDTSRIAAVGHSLGGHTVSLLMGMQVLEPQDPREKDLSDPRLKAGVVIGAPGVADEHFGPWAAEHYPSLRYLNFATMTGTTLVVAGDEDLNPNFSSRLSYRWDAYTHSPGGNKTLLTMLGAGHLFGGISGYDAAETSDENPARVAALRALVLSYLRSQLLGDRSWETAVNLLPSLPILAATVEAK
ncbi:chlorophyllase [Streptomyces sp. NBS 14/10]|uniref:alpha/beta hydrolase family protein n=1 Tax=Streptomyces sp. NBS 14/10 TaxID=1945643 RepID=UPI001C52A3EB|nr:chlorophyllase [Streptomyces sp. NBS 14/10]KAK1182252.1 chlorophyllase [Streptomyces sp. NBS 14/10]